MQYRNSRPNNTNANSAKPGGNMALAAIKVFPYYFSHIDKTFTKLKQLALRVLKCLNVSTHCRKGDHSKRFAMDVNNRIRHLNKILVNIP